MEWVVKRSDAWINSVLLAAFTVCAPFLHVPPVGAADKKDVQDMFHTSDRCVACHNMLKDSKGNDISIGLDWSASIMANSARDPYWQGSLRRETLDHPEVSDDIQDECSTCHMPMQHLMDRAAGRKTAVFARLPLSNEHLHNAAAKDGVSCSVCHLIKSDHLGSKASFNGNVTVASLEDLRNRPEYGPFLVDAGHKQVMQSSTAGFVPTQAAHMRDAGLCGSCHTLYTVALGAGGKDVGQLAEQMPYLEWLHSDYKGRQTCQDCHMPPVSGAVPVTALYGPPREGMHLHVFVGGNFLMERIFEEHASELAVEAQPRELQDAVKRAEEFMRRESARVTLSGLTKTDDGVAFDVTVDNLTGHKLPTAYPSRRAWLHVTVRGAGGNLVFESGALRPDGSIEGNDNDADAKKFEPHYTEITRPDEVEIFEPILKGPQGEVTTGLLTAVGYLKDNRILPSGFDKATAVPDIAVAGRAAQDPNFTGGSARVRYSVKAAGAGPFQITAELWYQPVGYRWAHNLAAYKAAEPERFVRYYEEQSANSALVVASAQGSLNE